MRVEERFLKYVSFPTAADAENPVSPSSAGQRELAEYTVGELLAIGLTDARVDGYGYVYATLPANAEGYDSIGLVAHMDTSPDAPGENIAARIVKYEGGDILLNAEKGIVMSEKEYPVLKKYAGQRLIVTDGTTLLGADDKAGIAEILTALEEIVKSNIPHGKIYVAITPDEEIGRGTEHIDLDSFKPRYAYTLDGGELGEIEYENFNAATARISITGVSIHPGSAKGKMKNAARIATEFDTRLDQSATPECTEGYEGFHHLTAMSGACESASLTYIIRDHDAKKFEEKKAEFVALTEKMNEKYGDGTLKLTITDSYRNMKEVIDQHLYTVERAIAAMKELGIEPVVIPIRGGTDGAQLSFMGIPCPNICAGGVNFHSRFEFVSVETMERITALVTELVKKAKNQ